MAVQLPEDHARQLFRVLPEGLAGVRRSRPLAMHVTLAFLGATSTDRLEEVVAAASAAASSTPSFAFTLGRLGRFPAEGAPRTIWARPADGGAQLAHLAQRVRTELRQRGIGFDGKPFQPHVTIARVAGGLAMPEARAVAAVVAAARPRLEPIPVREIAVVQSVLSPRGARYVRRGGAPLAASGAAA